MSRQLPSLLFLLLSLLLTLAGCGSVVGPHHPGEPLVTIQGQMNPTADARITGPVRLAFVWYPQWLAAEDTGGSQGGPVDVVTEDVVYQGSFPANYSFHLYHPPPESALKPLGDGLQGKGAFGILLAYQDGNGNAKLDTIPTNGAPVDRIIGSSLLAEPTSAAFTVIYVTTEQPAETGLKPGFNLIQAVNSENSAVVPLDTHMPLTLTQGGPFYDALVCEAGWLTFMFLDVCGLDGGIIIEPTKLAVDGHVTLDGAKARAELEVTLENTPLQDAAVTLAGRPLPYDVEREAYVLEEEDTTLLVPGGSFELVVNAGGESIRRTFQMPGDFDITSPAADEQVSASQPLELRWTASQGTDEYYVSFSSGSAGSSTTVGEGSLSHTFDTRYAGPEGTVQVEARIHSLDVEALVMVALVREQAFTFAP
ncbi:hypothetical protein F0U60_28445 [Archangium minus]|uniref:Lipoprotein n=1 Tax=Archangium minus TaxID=83450 RepID=A0ABY9WWU4_9BACT|nr:hypothetical protein F0U60_28445 [Archangium minus]